MSNSLAPKPVSPSTTSRRWPVIALLVALFVAGAGYFWLGAQPEGPVAVTAGETESARADRSSDANKWRPRTTRPVEVDKFVRKGRAAIAGHVRDGAEQGVRGATVCALRFDGLESLGRRRWCGTSGADGKFHIDELTEGSYALVANAPDYLPSSYFIRDEATGVEQRRVEISTAMVASNGTLTGVSIVMQRGGVWLRGRVVDALGGAVEGAQVQVRGNRDLYFRDGATAIAESDAEGTFSLRTPEGRVWVEASAPGYARSSTWSDAPSTGLTVRLMPGGSISGRVVTSDGDNTLAGIRVEAQRAMEGMTALPRSALEFDSTDDEGRFSVDGLVPGIYSLVARGQGYIGSGEAAIDLGLGESATSQTIHLIRGHRVEGKVVVGDRGHCREGRVSLVGEAGLGVHSVTSKITAEGSVVFEAVLPGVYRAHVYCAGHVARNAAYDPIHVDAGDLTGLRWQVASGVQLRGLVTDGGGQPVVRTHVSLLALTTDDPAALDSRMKIVSTDAEGVYNFAGVAPGQYELSLFRAELPSPEPGISVTVAARPSVQTRDIGLESGGVLKGQVLDSRGVGLAGLALRFEDFRLEHRAVQTDGEGRFRVEDLPVGPHRVMITEAHNQSPLTRPGASEDDSHWYDIELQTGVETELVVELQNRDQYLGQCPRERW